VPRTPLTILATLLTLAACGNGDEGAVTNGSTEPSTHAEYAGDAAQSVVPAPMPAPAPPEPAAARTLATSSAKLRDTRVETAAQFPADRMQNSMLVRTGNAHIQVDTLEPAIAAIRDIATQTGATIANTTISAGTNNIRNASIELRIPAQRFDAAVDALAAIGTVQSVNVQAIDVGEEFVDLEARLANSRRLEARLVHLLETRTGRLDDVLNVERELARVREQIERFEGRLRYLREHVALSTLTVAMHEPAPLTGAPGSNVLLDALVAAWQNLVGVIAFAIASLGFVVPIGGLAWLLWQWRRRRWSGAMARAGG